MFYNNFGGMHLIWWFIWVIFLIWIFATPYNIPGQQKKKDSPLDILRKRFASGQITKEEYQESKKNSIIKNIMREKLKNYALIATIFIVSAISSQALAQEKVNNDWVAPKEADQIANPLKGNDEATKAGKKLFQKQCVVCHGESGKGDGVAAVALKPKPASFKSEKVQNETDGAIFWKITNGRSPMASYKDLLTEEQRWQSVNYIRTFSK